MYKCILPEAIPVLHKYFTVRIDIDKGYDQYYPEVITHVRTILKLTHNIIKHPGNLSQHMNNLARGRFFRARLS